MATLLAAIVQQYDQLWQLRGISLSRFLVVASFLVNSCIPRNCFIPVRSRDMDAGSKA
jgi:hypothetical protein